MSTKIVWGKTGLAVQIAILALLGSRTGWCQTPGCPPGGSPGQWAKSATDLVSPSSDASCRALVWRDIRVYSPDHSKAVHFVAERWWVEVGRQRLYVGKGPSHCGDLAEMAWAPDNETFYITEGVGGLGPFTTQVYRVGDARIEHFGDINQPVRRLFDPKHGCPGYDENGKRIEYTASVVGFKWIDSGNQLLVVAAAPPDNTCAHASYFAGYLVSIADGKIPEQYTYQELWRGWQKFFGDELKGAYETITEK